MLEITDLSVHYGERLVLDQVSARVGRSGFLGVIGPNGAGKSTLIRAIAGLIPHDGEIRIDGKSRGQGGARAAARVVAYLPQRPVLPRPMTVTDYVLVGRSAHHSYLGAETLRDRRVVAAVLERLALSDLADRALGELSGGESQRVVLARALAQEAPVLVMDEPTTSLDLGYGQLVLELTDELRREKALCVLCAIHDLTLAAQFADRLLVLSEGRAVASGTAAEVITTENVARYFGATVEILQGGSGPVVAPVRSRTDIRALAPATRARVGGR